ncbi:hypothetical protein JCM21714_3712 [Gracilibacillus boraciitolerans JCM 21714]|uniref:Uncharacterized protein n=1 Tax=Gracilibacillus boraciitolerans JCM 21714 TaxID=1298598 RepID=W4VP74_9BACI|nr:hypothetical protein JCM21714_3712 [Gracilibacillus boraciitolerans JCM 21714]
MELNKKVKEKELKEQQDIIKHYESLVVASTNPSVRREKEMRSNVISINDKNKEQSLSLDIKSNFSTLFDD